MALVSCSRCGESAQPLTARRAEIASFAERIPRALGAAFTRDGLATLLGAGVVIWLLRHLGCLGVVFSVCVFFGLFFATLSNASRGESGIATPELSELFHDVIRPGLLGLMALLIVIGPALAWIVYRPGGWEASWSGDPVLWGLAVVSVLYVPMACIHAGLGGSVLGMLNPLAIVGGALRLGRDYAIAVGATGLLLVAAFLLTFLSAFLGSVPVLSGVLGTCLQLIGPMLMARTLGALMYVRGDDLGLGPQSDYQELLLPGATPRGSAPAAQAPGQPPTTAAPSARPPRPEAIELEPEAPAPVAPPPASAVEQLVEEVNRGDLPAAARLFSTLQTPQAVPAATLYALARSAAANEQYTLAAQALNVAGRSSDPEIAPNALLVLARILENRLQRPTDARAVLDHLVARYPGTPAAAQGRQLLGR